MKTPSPSEPDVEMVNYTNSLAVMDTGEVVKITNWLDVDGDETNDPLTAVVAIAGPMEDGSWMTIDLSVFTQLTVN